MPLLIGLTLEVLMPNDSGNSHVIRIDLRGAIADPNAPGEDPADAPVLHISPSGHPTRPRPPRETIKVTRGPDDAAPARVRAPLLMDTRAVPGERIKLSHDPTKLPRVTNWPGLLTLVASALALAVACGFAVQYAQELLPAAPLPTLGDLWLLLSSHEWSVAIPVGLLCVAVIIREQCIQDRQGSKHV